MNQQMLEHMCNEKITVPKIETIILDDDDDTDKFEIPEVTNIVSQEKNLDKEIPMDTGISDVSFFFFLIRNEREKI